MADQADRSHARFESLLEEALRQPEARAAVFHEIEAQFGQERAVLVADVDSFTATTVKHGILAFLLVLHQVQQATRPILARNGGLALKSEADTLFCLFPTVPQALRAAREVRQALAELDLRLCDGSPVTLGIGIGYGALLNLADTDALGAEVNFAYKLGEDVARRGEILLTRAAREQVPEGEHAFEERSAVVSGLTLPYFVLR